MFFDIARRLGRIAIALQNQRSAGVGCLNRRLRAATHLPFNKVQKEQRNMRPFKLIGVLAIALAFGASAIASAAETLWKWLPGSAGETFHGKSGEVVLSWKDEATALTVKCKSALLLLSNSESKISSELLSEGSTEGKDATLGLGIVDFEGCQTLGLSINSQGDKAGIVLMHVEEHNCMIGPGKFGVLLKILPLHAEVPAAKILLLKRGNVLGLLEGAKQGEKALTYKLNLKTNANKEQEFKKCEGGEEEKVEVSLDGVNFFPATLSGIEAIGEFDMTKDKEGEEMMEK
jgi:hypothetical protein